MCIRDRPALTEKLGVLKADPVLGDLHEKACIWHRERINALLQQPDPLKLFLRLINTETATLSPRLAAGLNPLIARSWDLERAERKGK